MDESLTRCENSRRYAMKIAEYGAKSLKKLFFSCTRQKIVVSLLRNSYKILMHAAPIIHTVIFLHMLGYEHSVIVQLRKGSRISIIT